MGKLSGKQGSPLYLKSSMLKSYSTSVEGSTALQDRILTNKNLCHLKMNFNVHLPSFPIVTKAMTF